MCLPPTRVPQLSFFFFFNDTATTEIYTLSLHDALPIYGLPQDPRWRRHESVPRRCDRGPREGRVLRSRFQEALPAGRGRSEEHTSELQSPDHLVCRLLLEKKKTTTHTTTSRTETHATSH